MTDQLTIAEVEFNAIKANLIAYLETKTEFLDVNFEGAGINYMVDALAYATHYMGFYHNMGVNEMFLGTAILRKNINATSKSLNYLPRRPTGAESTLTFEVKDIYKPVNPLTVITVPKYTDFIIDNYHFFSTTEYLLTNANNYTFEGVVIRQGSKSEESSVSTGLANQEIIIENANIDNDTLLVYVASTLWTMENNIVTVDEDSLIYSVELTDDNYVKIIFGDDIIGNIPPLDSTITVIYTETVGTLGNNYSTFSMNDIIVDNFSGTYDNSKVDLTVTEQSLGGADWETLASIKLNAPKFYESQGRLVTKSDWTSTLAQHQLVESVNVWGGEEDTINPTYGYVYIAIKPPAPAENLTDSQKNTITEYIDNRNIAAIRFAYIDVTYFYINFTGTIYYDQRYEAQQQAIRDAVESATVSFFADELEDFDSLFKMARYITEINNVTEINNTNISVQAYYKFSKVGTGSYAWLLDNTIVTESIDCDIMTGLLNEGFYDDGEGFILTKKTGNAVIGTINYTTGYIEILPGYEITATEPSEGFTVNFEVPDNDVYYKLGRKVALGTITYTYTRYV